MEIWENIIHTAMLGTEKKVPAAEELNEALLPAFNSIQANENIDKEEKFLQLASVLFNYRQCGTKALQKDLPVNISPEEEKNYCSTQSLQVLQDILNEENIPLLQFWLQHCSERAQIVTAPYVPALLSLGTQYKKIQALVSQCCGKRGTWLAGFNPAWQVVDSDTPETIWQTGTIEHRKVALGQIRKTDAAKGLEWLQQTWPQEDAATRVALLELLRDTINEEDITFLEGLTTDKSKKVKEEALYLLKSVPGSAIVQQYTQALRQAVQVKQGKSMPLLTFRPVTDESIFKTGIDKLSATKEITDDDCILMQLTEQVPPVFWEEQLQADRETVLAALRESETGKKLIPALANAVVRFKDTAWAAAIAGFSDPFYIEVIPLLSAGQQDAMAAKYMSQLPEAILQYAAKFSQQWSPQLTREVFKYTSNNTYQYNRAFYSNIIHLLPSEELAELETIVPAQEYYRDQWTNLVAWIIKLVQLKQQTIQSFNK